MNIGDISIKRKLTFIIMLTSLVVLLLASAAFLINDLVSFRNSMVYDLETLARIIGTNSSAAIMFNDQKGAEDVLSALSAKPRVSAAYIYRADGRILANYIRNKETPQKTPVMFKGRSASFRDDHLFVAQPVMLDGNLIGSVSIMYDLDDMYERIKSYIGIIVVVILVVFPVALLLSSKLQSVISAPILKLAETARTISREKKFSLRAEKHGSDEIGMLMDGFNEMLSQIQERDAMLERHRDYLEEQVAQRTAELRAANQDLMNEMAERARTEEELLKARRLESIGLLAGGIAHDFNNLLTAIVGNISLSKMFVNPAEKVYKRLIEAEKASMRARDLTQQLLTFSKGGAPIKKTASIAELLIDSASFALSGSNVKCEFCLPEDLSSVDIDEGQISQVVNNVIINADHAMTEGGLIRVKAENVLLDEDSGFPLKQGNYVKISIEDQGTGISAEHLPKIFDPYFTTKAKGTGLGLTTCYSIIKRHEGLITAESKMGEGTTFYIFLPASNQAIPGGKNIADGPIRGSGRILVMDDEEIIREVAVKMLSHLGYQVDCAADGAEAIGLYLKAKSTGNSYSAVIIDLTIPGGMGGKEAIQRLREIDPEIKAIVSSGYSHGPIMSEYRKFGFCSVAAKPYKVEDLSRAVHEAISETISASRN